MGAHFSRSLSQQLLLTPHVVSFYVNSSISYPSRSTPHSSSSAFSAAMDNQPSYMISGLRMPCDDCERGRNNDSPGEKVVDSPEDNDAHLSKRIARGNDRVYARRMPPRVELRVLCVCH